MTRKMTRMIARISAVLMAVLAIGLLSYPTNAQQTGVMIGGGGPVFSYVLPMPVGTLAIGQGGASNPQILPLTGDCTLTAGGVITCTKSNGASFGTAATANTGSSGTAVPLLNVPNTFSALQTFTAHVAVGTSAPSLGGCGGGSPAIVGDDKDGEVTMGTSATGCVITFATAYNAAPLCTVSWQATPLASQSYSVSTTALTTVQTSTSSNKLNYHCVARNGG